MTSVEILRILGGYLINMVGLKEKFESYLLVSSISMGDTSVEAQRVQLESDLKETRKTIKRKRMLHGIKKARIETARKKLPETHSVTLAERIESSLSAADEVLQRVKSLDSVD